MISGLNLFDDREADILIELFEQDLRKNDRQSSKGNQLKWENNGIWYKADYTGYEGLAEYLCAHFLKMSSLEEKEFVDYEIEEITYRSKSYLGAKSRDFLKEGWQVITLERLFKNTTGHSFTESIYHIEENEERLHFLVDQVERLTGIRNFGIYMNKLLTIDALFLNEDRHLHNIDVLMDGGGKFELCPIFDNGAALLSDTSMDYPLDGDIYRMVDEVEAKTFCDDFYEQLDVSERLYGNHIQFAFSHKDVEALLQKDLGYDRKIIERVVKILHEQMRKYEYLFSQSAPDSK